MSEVVLEMLGQASVAIRLGGFEVVSDPWVVRKAQLGAWQPFPPRSAEDMAAQLARVDRCTHVYISHDHADHFDPEVLSRLAPKHLVVARFQNSTFRSALQALARNHGHTVTELTPGEILEAGDLSLRIMPEQPKFRTNSMLLVNTPCGAILNANDCGLNSAVLRGIAQRQPLRVFLYTLNFMANGYPFPYLSSKDANLSLRMDELRRQVVDSFRVAMETLKPELSIAFAGPVTFAGPATSHLNAHPEAIDWRAMVNELSAVGRICWPTPGSHVTLNEASLVVDEPTTWAELLARPSTREEVALPAVEQLDRVRFDAAVAAFLNRVGSSVARAGQRLEISLYLSVVPSLAHLESPDLLGTVRIRLDGPCQTGWVENLEPPYLRITSTPSVLSGFLEGRITLDELLLSAHARFSRDPDVFHGGLHNFLRFGHDAEATEALLAWLKQKAQSRATITRDVGGKRYVLPKFCPHEGESLDHASIENGRVVCPRHKWCFDVETGVCVAIGDPSVNLYQDVR
jgi:UDP-MurNAc hydroxylase